MSGPASLVTGRGRDRGEIPIGPSSRPTLAITYHLDYGPRSPIPAQELTVEITPESFQSELAFARTFVFEREAQRTAGGRLRSPHQPQRAAGVRGRTARSTTSCGADDEFARHKILDCLGDFALLGCDIQGHFSAYRSGHHLNREMVRQLLARAAYEGDARSLGAPELNFVEFVLPR